MKRILLLLLLSIGFIGVNAQCDPPTGLNASAISTDSALLNWTASITAGATYNWEVQPVDSAQGSASLIASGTTAGVSVSTGTGLISATSYDFFVQSDCSTDSSTWTVAFTFTTLPDYCGSDNFYDNGGATGDYAPVGSGTPEITTIFPDMAGDVVTVTFNSFNTESGWDGLMIYDGPSTASPLISSGSTFNRATCPNGAFTGTTTFAATGPYTSTHASGALTFAFTADANVAAGWDASISCDPGPACSAPANLSVTDITTTSAILDWDTGSFGTPTEYYVEYDTTGFTQGTGTLTTVVGFDTLAISGLTSATTYDWYIRAYCGGTDTSDWVGPNSFTTLPDYCGGDNFYDNGGATGDYAPVAAATPEITTIFPDMAGDVVTATFNSFATEEGWDGLMIYDGPSTAAPLISSGSLFNRTTCPNGAFTGGAFAPTAPITSTHASGALTFAFRADGGVDAGWDVSITCAPAPTCSSPANQTVNSIMTTSAVLDWDTGLISGTQWYVEYDTAGFTQGMGTTVSVMTFDSLLVTGLIALTDYDWYVLADCGSDSSVWLGPNTFTTAPDYCAGDHFYDNGGAAGDYAPVGSGTPEITTIFPDMAGDVVTATFNSFATEEGWDGLMIYDGPNTSSPLISSGSTFNRATCPNGAFTGGSFAPAGPITSTHATGALTFAFTADGGVDAGWDATITCAAPPTCGHPENTSVTDITDVSAILDWDTSDIGTATQYFVEYDTSGFPQGMGTMVTVMTFDSLLLAGLTSNTSYDWYVSSYCGPADTSIWVGPHTFKTNPPAPQGVSCVSAGANPTPLFLEDFETAGLPGWTGTVGTGPFGTGANWNTNTGTTGSSNTGPNAAFSGSTYLYFEGSTSGTGTLVSPPIDLTGALDDVELTFMMHAYGIEMGTFSVGVGTSVSGPFTNVFTYVGELQTSSADAWVPIGVDLSGYLGSTIYIELLNTTTTVFEADMSIDSLVVSACATCTQPLAGISTPTTTSAHIEWDGSGSPFGIWQVEWDTVGFTPGIGSGNTLSVGDPELGIGVGNDTAFIGGLTSASTYDWYVVNICVPGSDTSSIAGPFTFSTLSDFCGSDNFYDNGGASGNYVPVAAATPEITTIFPDMAGDVVTATFSSFNTENGWDGLMIYDGPNTSSPLISSGSTFNRATCPNGAFTGTTTFAPSGPITSTHATGALTFAFTADAGVAAGWEAVITCALPPTCFQASALTASNQTFTSVDLSWTPGATGTPHYILEYDTAGFTQGTGNIIVITADTFTSITGLTAETSYEWYVRDSCSVGDVGPWSSVGEFFTGYCDPFYSTGTGFGDLISNVEITGTTLSNNSGTGTAGPYYTYYNTLPNHTASLQAGTSYDVVVSNGSFGNQHMAAWIDFNDDLVFDISERIGFTASSLASNSTATFTISLPCNPPVGLHRMRIRDNYSFAADGSGIDPCAPYTWGETEDYDVTILAPPPCPQISSLALFGTVTTNSASFDWNTGCTETMWDYEINTSATAPTGTPANVAVTDTFVNATGLNHTTTYYAHVRANCGGGLTSAWSTITFTTDGIPPVNDTCTGAITLACGATDTVTTEWATSDAAMGACGTGSGGTPAIGVWYSFIGTGEDVQVSLCGSDFDTKLHIYSGACGTLTCLDSNDDGALCGGLQSALSFTSVLGTQYYFLAGGFGTATGTLEISVTCIPAGAITWLGNSNDYSSGTNWSSGIVPTCADDIFIPLTANDPIITGAFACNDFGTGASVTTDVTITGTLGVCGDVSLSNGTDISGPGTMSLNGTNGGATFDVSGTASVDVLDATSDYAITGNLMIDDALILTSGNINASGANIVLNSTATSTAYLDDFSGATPGTYTGDITVETFVTTGSGLGQRFFGSAVVAGAIDGLDQTYATGYPSGQIIPDVCNVSIMWNSPYSNMFEWHEDATFASGCEQEGWFAIDDATAMTPARGYSGWMNDGTVISATGAPSTGAISYVTTGTSGTGPAAADGWHLLSNPYPSPITVAAYTSSGFTSPQFYDGSSAAFYGTFTPAVLAGNFASMQGFFAESTGAGTVSVTNADRVASNAVAFVSSSTIFDQMLTVNVLGNGFGDKTYLYYSNDNTVTTGFDNFGDCKKRNSNLGQPTIYTNLGTERMALNGYPETSIGESIPLGVDHGADGNFELSFEGMTNFPANTTIYVEDMQAGVYHNIADGNYAYAALATDNSDRFMIHFVLPVELATVNVNCAGDLGKIELVSTTGIVNRDYVIAEATNTVATGALSTLNESVASGTYEVTINDEYGGNQVYTVTVGEDEAIEAVYTVSSINVQVGEVVSFDNTTMNTTTVEWTIADLATVTGVNNATYTFDEVGTYEISLMVSNDDCSDVKTFEVNVSNKTTSTTTLSADNLIKVYSNEDVVTISFENDFNANAKVEIQNAIGQKVFAGTVRAEGTQTINIEEVTTGYYFVSVEVEGERLSSKIFLTKK